MSGYGYGFNFDRLAGTFDVFVLYDIDPYEDPETGEVFEATSWNFTLSGDGTGGGGGWGGPAESILIPFTLPDGRVDFGLHFFAQNSFSAASISFDLAFQVDAYATADLNMRGGDGTDILVSGSGNDLLAGTIGDDHLDAGDGDDRLLGGSGRDILLGGAGADTMTGGGGSDSYDMDDAGDVIVELADGGYDSITTAVNNYVLGDNLEAMFVYGGMTTSGNALDNAIYGSFANDSIDGGGGNDTIQGGGGGGRFSGGEGNDQLYGGVPFSGTSLLMLLGGGGDDVLAGELGATTRMIGGAGADLMHGYSALNIWASYELSSIGLRADLADAASNSGEAAGDIFVNVRSVMGSAFADTLGGDGETNNLRGEAGDDSLTGRGGNDTLEGRLGADALDGGEGIDTADYRRAAAGLNADLLNASANSGEAAGDSFVSIENLSGSSFADTLAGGGGANLLQGGAGDDMLIAREGDDTVVGGAGSDSLDGGEGIDTLSYQTATASMRVDLLRPVNNRGEALGDTVAGFENLIGGSASDTLLGDQAANRISGGNGSDRLNGRGGADTLLGGNFSDTLTGAGGGDVLNGGLGIDTADYSTSTAGIAIDLVTRSASGGHAAGDTLAGIEYVIGSAHNDTLSGNQDFYVGDLLVGGAGDDWLDGRRGPDTLVGGMGADTLDSGDDEGWEYDWLDYRADTQGVAIDLSLNTASGGDAEGDVISGFELVLGGSGNDTLTGDAKDFHIYNYLYGGGGSDVLRGLDDVGTIYSARDELFGEAGNDTLVGASQNGFTQMTGGDGADRFVIVRSTGFFGEGVHDLIKDFDAEDQIALTRDGSLGPAIGLAGALSASAFRVGTAAGDADDRIVYDPATGRIWFDADGTGGGTQALIAIVENAPTLDAADFIVI